MSHILTFMALITLAITQSGCVIACGPGHSPSPQKLQLITDSPSAYTIRVVPSGRSSDEPFDTPVPADGRVEFQVPVYAPYCRQYLFGVVRLNPDGRPEDKRAIRVMRGTKTVRRLSADSIAKLPADTSGFHMLRIE